MKKDIISWSFKFFAKTKIRNVLILVFTLFSLISCRTFTKKSISAVESQSEKIQIQGEKQEQKSTQLYTSTTDSQAFENFFSQLNLTPKDSTKPAINRIYKNGKEVFRQEVENASYTQIKNQSKATQIKDSIVINSQIHILNQRIDSLYQAQSNYTYQYQEIKRKAKSFLIYALIFAAGVLLPKIINIIKLKIFKL